jgi:hypothetical protein
VGGKGETLHSRGGTHFQALKVPRQCPLVLLVEVRLREGKALGSGFHCEQMTGVEQGLCCV